MPAKYKDLENCTFAQRISRTSLFDDVKLCHKFARIARLELSNGMTFVMIQSCAAASEAKTYPGLCMQW